MVNREFNIKLEKMVSNCLEITRVVFFAAHKNTRKMFQVKVLCIIIRKIISWLIVKENDYFRLKGSSIKKFYNQNYKTKVQYVQNSGRENTDFFFKNEDCRRYNLLRCVTLFFSQK